MDTIRKEIIEAVREKVFYEEVSVKDECICIKVGDGGSDYDIELSRIDNPTKLVWWIYHLSQKCWLNNFKLEKLIEISMEKMGIQMYQGEG